MFKQLLVVAMSVVLGACAVSDVWRPGDGPGGGADGGGGSGGSGGGGSEQPAGHTQPSPETPDATPPLEWPDAEPQRVTIPNNPWLSQRGKTLSRAEVERFPARYARQHERILILGLSGASNMRLKQRYNSIGQAIIDSGWSVLDASMRQAQQLGYNEVWIRGWTGGHPITDEFTGYAMPFPMEGDVPSQAWLNDWRRFRDRWTQRGMRMGVYVGTVLAPNFGTQTHPDHRFITRDDFEYVEDTLAWLKVQGFDVAGLDAMSLISAGLDEPANETWRQTTLGGRRTPPREKGIALDLMRHLNRSPRLQGLRLVAESEMPPGAHQAEMPCMIIVRSRKGSAERRVTIDTIPTLKGSADEIIVPGVEKIALIHGDNWTRPEYMEAVRVLEEKGYRVAVDWFVLSDFELGMLDLPGVPK